MGGKRCSNRISTTLPRTEATEPRFEVLGLSPMDFLGMNTCRHRHRSKRPAKAQPPATRRTTQTKSPPLPQDWERRSVGWPVVEELTHCYLTFVLILSNV